MPALKMSALHDLRNSLKEGIVALNVEGRNIDEILGMQRTYIHKRTKRERSCIITLEFSVCLKKCHRHTLSTVDIVKSSRDVSETLFLGDGKQEETLKKSESFRLYRHRGLNF